MPIYLKMNDELWGDATQQDHKNWMDIQTLHWNVSRNMNTQAGSSSNREASEPAVSEVTLQKVTDKSSTRLFQEGVTGNKGMNAVIHMVTTGSPGQTYIEYKLYNTLVSGYTVASGGDRPAETLVLNFTKMDVKYTPYDDKNTPQSPSIASYDLSTTKSG